MDRPSSHSQRVPYARKEGRKSLFSKMKDSMKDMLSPSWLTDYVHKAKKESTTDLGNVQKGSDKSAGMQPRQSDSSPSQTPVLAPGQAGMIDSSSQQAGMQFKNRGTFVGNGQPRTLDFAGIGQGINPSGQLASPFQHGGFPPPISEFTSAQLPLARITEKSDSIMAQEDTLSQRSDGSKSTSGCSSMVQQADIPQRNTVGDKRKAPEQATLGGTSPQEQQVAKRQRLHPGNSNNQTFNRRLSDTFISKRPAAAVTNRPAFNTSLFGSPLNNESSLLGTSIHESSFYPGKTKFGGRSSLSFRSQRKNVDLNQSLPSRLSVPVKAFMKARPRLTPNKEAVTSSTAKRILEALDKMPTPLNDAKKIPMVPRQWTESPSFFSRDLSRSVTRSGPPTQKLNISSQASISKNRQVSFAPLQQPKASTSQEGEVVRRPSRQDTVILNNEGLVSSGKMKRDKSYHRGSASVKTTLEEDDTVIIPNLNTEFTLPVSSMPQFSFATPASRPQEDKAMKSIADSPVKQALNFTFSSPIIEPVPTHKPASPQKYGGFQFSSPISVEKKSDNTEPTLLSKPFAAPSTSFGSSSAQAFAFSSPAVKSNMDISFSTAPKPKPKANGPVEVSGGGFQVASQLKQGSVMDILGGGSSGKSSKPSSQVSTPLSSAPPLSEIFKKTGWSCDVCLVNNKDADSKCVACQTPKPVGQVAKVSQVSSAPPLSEIFKKTGWSCGVCLVNNKDADSKCVACQTPKPGGEKLTGDPAEPLKSDLFAKFKQPVGSWTCDTCLIQNKQDDIKCVACQSRKPGSASTSSSPLVSSIQPGNWICNVCLIQNKKDDTICGACKAAKSTPKPSDLNKSDNLFAKFKPPAGSWECEVCLVQNKTDDNKCVACQTPKPFKFFKHPPGDWTCDTCLVNNKEAAVNCVACNYARPGPPRTQAVPSIAKSYTVSQASGFNLPSTESGGITISSTGGFKIAVSTSAPSTASGFDVSKINATVKTSADSKLSGGFKINSDVNSGISSGSGFKFGGQSVSESDKTSVNFGGFKVNAVAPSEDKPSSGFQFGKDKDMKRENVDGPIKSAGFQFGKSDSSVSSNKSSSTSEQVTSVGFVFGQSTVPAGTKGDINTSMSVPGGFSSKPSDSVDSSINKNATETITNTSKSIGGFNFTSLNSNSVATTSSSSLGNFAFTATKVTDSSVLSGTSNQLGDTKPTVGGFTFSQKPAESNTSSSPFTFAQNSTSVASPVKRGREDDTGEPALKKSFGQTATATSSTPFQFGANSVVTSSSNSSTPFVFGGQPTTSTSANVGLFAFGQQSSTPSTASQPVFGLQNSTPASSALPSVFGQQNSTVVTTSSTSSSFGVFAAPVASSTTPLPVFGQTNSNAAATTASASTPSLFQFGQANKTTSTPFNFATQSSGQTSVFGNGNFNFTTQKTESSTSGSTSELFKFGGAPSQPAPATTPAFGSGSAFGSSSAPAFGSGSGSTVAFSGNAPSTTPAFGATPPAFGSSNSSTGQPAPAFGGNVSCLNVPVVSTCLPTAQNVSFLSICTSTAVISSCVKTSVSVCPTVVSLSSSSKDSSYAISKNSTDNSTQAGNQQNQRCHVKLKSSRLSLLATCSQSRDWSKDSFFNDDCYDNTVEDVKVDMPIHKAAVDCKEIVLKYTNKGTVEEERSQDGTRNEVETSRLVDELCQTDETVTVDLKTEDTESCQKNINSRSVILPTCSIYSQSKGVQTELLDIGETSSCTKNVTQSTRINRCHHDEKLQVTLRNTKEYLILNNTIAESSKPCVNLPNSPISSIPKTGVANEPLTCGKLFIVPCFAGCLDNSVRYATAITQPLMTSRLSLPAAKGMSLPSKGVVNNEFMFMPPSNTQSKKGRSRMLSSYRFSRNGDTSLQVSSLNSPLFGNLNLPSSTATSTIFSNLTLPRSSLPKVSSLNFPVSSSTMLSNLNSPGSAATSVMFGNMSLPCNTSSILGMLSFPSSSSQVFGNWHLPNSSVISTTLCSVNLPSSSLFSPIFANLDLPNRSVNSSAMNRVSLLSSQDESVIFGNQSLQNFSNVNMTSSSVNLGSPVTAAFSSAMKKGTIDNKTGFVLNIPFVQGTNAPETKVSRRTETFSSSQSTSSSASSLFVFGGHTKTSEQPFTPISCKPYMFLQDTKVCNNESQRGNVLDHAVTSTNSVFVFGSSLNSDKHYSIKSKSPTFFSRKSVFNNRSGNVETETSHLNTKGISSNNGTGVFSFQGPAVLNDVVMEDGSVESTTNYSSGSEASRRVKFSLNPPIVPNDDLCSNDPLNDNKVGKSILKSKISELRSAFHSATLTGKEIKEQAGNSSFTGEVDKLPSDSCILREKSIEALRLVCNSRSMPFTSDFMMKEEHGELSMDISVATKHDQKSIDLMTENPLQGEKISQFNGLSGNNDNKFNLSRESEKKSEDVPKSPQCFKKMVNFGTGQAGSSFPSNVFSFTVKVTSESDSKKSPPPNNLQSSMKFENCSNTNQATTISVCSGTFSTVSPNIFLFSSVMPQSKKSAEISSLKVKKGRTLKTKSKPSVVSAFSGKLMDKNTSFEENELSPKSSESSQSASGSDSNTNSSASSDSGHSVSSSSSSSSSTCDNSDDDSRKSDRQPMEDDTALDYDNTTNTTGFSGLGNRSWNACPLEENSAENVKEELNMQINKVNMDTNKIIMVDLSININIVKISHSVNSGKPAEFESRCALKENSLDYFVLCPLLLSGVFGNTSQPAAPAQSNSVFQFGVKPADSTPAAPSVGFNFAASANPAGLGTGGTSFNFTAQAPTVNAFSATGTPDGRKIKKAIRKIRR